ncbi:heavy metal-responsive transcriptional regulator [Streptomyces sp. NBC_00572]|uniref:heavy metal-responsive transcriptional regulator n=1 Tax=Streptomyces sp. NBC_00572 TaxID=2903664 RepID=UPI002258D516|nr:heavy metal-responsive transcriptional regulator [Streptomyces sp. NBC_00572]MCX4985317.1 heavy metal-responsive transcriptional regulator [Streptomyces sp. NBC_00572]
MRIGDLAARAGLTTKTLRFYEDRGLLPAPLRTPGGYRGYPEHAVTRLAFVRDAQRAGLTLAEIRSVLALRDDGHLPCAHVTGLIHEHLDDIARRMSELAATRDVLRTLADRAAVTDPAACEAEGICTILTPVRP